MTSGSKCGLGCACGRHTRPNRLTDQERSERQEEKRENDRNRRRVRLESDPAYLAQVREVNRQKGRGYSMKHRHGITLEQWDELLTAQAGCCYLCNEPLVEGNIHVDHDHACCRGKRSCGSCIRGLACQKCNQGIGQFGDDPERMRRVADNLEMANRALRMRESFPKTAVVTPAGAGSNAPAPATSKPAFNPRKEGTP